MRVFVTGATGFVGRHVADALAASGHELVCLARSTARAEHLLAAGHEVVEGHILDEAVLARGVAGAEGVVHVAGLIAAPSHTEMRRVNVEGTALLARACRAAPPRRFVLVSSLAAAGPSTPGRPVREEDAARPISGYGTTKLLGERAAAAGLGPETALTVVRPPAVYGPHDRGMLDLFLAAARGVRLRLGDARISIVHGTDLADGIRRALEVPAAGGRTYFVANAQAHTMNELLGRICGAVGRRGVPVPVPRCVLRAAGVISEEVARVRGLTPPFSRDKVREFLAPGWACDPGRAMSELDWAPRHALDDGLRATAEWYRAAGWIP